MVYNCIRMYQKAQSVQLTLFTPSYFDIVIADNGWEWNYPHHTFFWTQNCYLLTWKLATHILSILKTFWMWRGIFYWSHHISVFFAGYLAFILFVRLEILVLFFLSSPCFASFNALSIKTHLLRGYFTSNWFGGG